MGTAQLLLENAGGESWIHPKRSNCVTTCLTWPRCGPVCTSAWRQPPRRKRPESRAGGCRTRPSRPSAPAPCWSRSAGPWPPAAGTSRMCGPAGRLAEDGLGALRTGAISFANGCAGRRRHGIATSTRPGAGEFLANLLPRRLAYRKHDYYRAEQSFNRCIGKNARLGPCYYNLARTQEAAGRDANEVIKNYTEAALDAESGRGPSQSRFALLPAGQV